MIKKRFDFETYHIIYKDFLMYPRECSTYSAVGNNYYHIFADLLGVRPKNINISNKTWILLRP